MQELCEQSRTECYALENAAYRAAETTTEKVAIRQWLIREARKHRKNPVPMIEIVEKAIRHFNLKINTNANKENNPQAEA
jgi:hypothetical protein